MRLSLGENAVYVMLGLLVVLVVVLVYVSMKYKGGEKIDPDRDVR